MKTCFVLNKKYFLLYQLWNESAAVEKREKSFDVYTVSRQRPLTVVIASCPLAALMILDGAHCRATLVFSTASPHVVATPDMSGSSEVSQEDGKVRKFTDFWNKIP